MSKVINRRNFVRQASIAAGASMVFSATPLKARRLEKPTLLGIGAGGKGRTDLEQCSQVGFDVIALADVVDTKKLKQIQGKREKSMAQVRDAYPDAKFGTDYRQLIEELGDKIDAVVVATPDHHHFHASVQAMLAGKHVYCQKPLTHGIWEARTMAQVAHKTGVKTQMGNQAHANDHMRRCVELIRAGIVGKVSEIHTWTNRPIWPQGFARPPEPQKVPAGIDWKQWVGPAPWVDYSPVIAPFAWRGWWNYGTGALGDMACHIMDLGYWAMQSKAPLSVVAEQQGATEYSPPINSRITWDFAANQFSSERGFKFHWYDGYLNASFNRANWELEKASEEYNHPSADVLDGMDFNNYGCVVIGEHGKLFFHRGREDWVLHANNRIEAFQWPKESLPRATDQNSYQEWLDAIQGHIPQAESNFLHSGPFTETVLLGVLAQRVPGQILEWDANTMQIKGRPELDKWIRREYAEGWKAEQLLGAALS
ncbi:MAG: Gfo/Idh/MocA family oxidoreductase [bacterium]|nr:Gfo/Idh/MocA family oxidoreductase [bacterium]